MNEFGPDAQPSSIEAMPYPTREVYSGFAELERSKEEMRSWIARDIVSFGDDAVFKMRIERPSYYSYYDNPSKAPKGLYVRQDISGEGEEPEYVTDFQQVRSGFYSIIEREAVESRDFTGLIEFAEQADDPYYAKTLLEKAHEREMPSVYKYVGGSLDDYCEELDQRNQMIREFKAAFRSHIYTKIDEERNARVGSSFRPILTAIIEELRPYRINKYFRENILPPLAQAASKPIIEEQILDEELFKVGKRRFRLN